MMKKKCGFNHAMQEGLFLLVLGGWLLWYSLDAYQHSYIKDWAQSPSLFPVIVACLLGLFGVILFRQGVVEKMQEKQQDGQILQGERPDHHRRCQARRYRFHVRFLCQSTYRTH